WDFAAPSPADLASLLQWFNVGITSKDGSIQMHSVSTVVIGPDGKISAWYPSNDWTPQQALQDVRQALAPMPKNNGARQSL
ncbi:MAG: hypothetical protein H0X25_21010, partial [Acidobacteriales bacterium]|nr:hypothetical protein [Terriglobales bacterium]